MIKQVLKRLYRKLGNRGYFWPMPQLCASQMRSLGLSNRSTKKNILALAAGRYTGDLELLASSREFSVTAMKHYWQYAVMDLVGNGGYHLNNPERVRICKNFLVALKKVKDFDCVISPCLWYRQDLPWAEAAVQADIPFILFHKENLKVDKAQLGHVVERAKRYGPFKGTHVVVHNEVIRKALIDASYVKPSQITSLGAMRMDGLAKAIASKPRFPQQKRAVLFSFAHRADGSLPDHKLAGQSGPFPENPYLGWVRLFESTHTAFARAAMAMPTARFIIKLKWEDGWAERVKQALSSNGITLDEIPNLSIDSSSDPHDLIIDAQVVCGFNSTTVLEAGVFDKTVIIPMFDEALREDYRKAVKHQDAHHLFEVANSPIELSDLIVGGLQKAKSIDKIVLKKRREYFENLIAPLDGKVGERYIELLNDFT